MSLGGEEGFWQLGRGSFVLIYGRNRLLVMGMSRVGDPDEHQMPRPPRPLAHTDQGVEAPGSRGS